MLRKTFSAAERSTHPSPEQTEALLQYLAEHPELARGFPKLPAAKARARRHWQQLTPRLNNIGNSVKTWQQWTKYWADKKLSVKRKAAVRETAVRSGGDPDLVMELTDVEQQILILASNNGARDHGARRQTDAAIGCETSCSEIDITTTSAAETLMMDDSEVVLLVSPATLMQEASPSHSPARSPAVTHSPQDSDRGTFQPCNNNPQQFRYPGTKKRRRGTSQQPQATRRSHIASLTQRFLTVEQQRLALARRTTAVLETLGGVASQMMERDYERERVFAQALQTVGDGLRLLAEAVKRERPVENV